MCDLELFIQTGAMKALGMTPTNPKADPEKADGVIWKFWMACKYGWKPPATELQRELASSIRPN